MALSGMRGSFVRLVFGDQVSDGIVPDLMTIAIRHTAPSAPAASCWTSDPAGWNAYAIVTGLSAQALDGAQVLIDAQGWLRRVHLPSAPGNWNDPKVLSQNVTELKNQPVTQAAGNTMSMPMNMKM